MRTDLRWYDLEPKRDAWDQSKLDFYSRYIDQAKAAGLDPLMLFSSPPGWAVKLYRENPPAFWREYEAYVARVLKLVADRVSVYQLWNEANHLIDPIRARDDWQLFSRAGALVRKLDPGARTCINVMADLPGWESSVTRWLRKAGAAIDIIGIDHYPGTWSLRQPTTWKQLHTLIRRINTKGNPWYGKQGAVMETGYSAWSKRVANEDDQKRWIGRCMPALRTIIRRANSQHTHKILFGAYYQLIDAKQPLQEGAFGILRRDLSKKRGAELLKKELKKFSY